MKKILTLLSIFVLFGIFSAKIASAQTSEEVTKKYGITFPISQLGNCKDITTCKTYCDDPINIQSCIDYAKGKGFYKESEAKPNEAVIQKAKATLGCDSPNSCKSFCEKEENFDKCHSFAQNTGLSGGYKEDPTKGQVLTKAKETLGCDSYDTCKNFCDNPVNHDKCAQFAQNVGVRGGYEYRGPGGCTTEETCKVFCQDSANTDTCKQFAQTAVRQSNYDPQTECKKYPNCTWSGNYCSCSQNPNDPGNVERQKAQCSSYPGCTWTGNGNECRCGSSNPMSRESQETACKAGGGSCNWNGNVCNCQGYDSSKDTRPETQCARSGNGCYWNGTSCSCSHTGGSPIPTDGTSYGNASQGDYSCGQAALAVGCYTVDKTCKCPSRNTPYPTSGGGTSNYTCGQAAIAVGCYNEGNYCKCPNNGGSSGGGMPSREQQEAACRSGGGTCVSWNNNTCGCQRPQDNQPSQTQAPQQQTQQQSQPDPASQCSSYPGCSWNGSSCQCSNQGVQGVYTVAGWFQQAIYFVENLLGK